MSGEFNESSFYSITSFANDGFSVFSFSFSLIIMIAIFSFLHNSSPAKECILLYLHKDLLVMLISLRSMWCLKILLTDDQSGMGEYTAKALLFCLWSMIFTVLALINMISALKLYIIRTVVLDPPMPWGTDEKIGMACIRSILGLIAVGYPSILFGIGLYPTAYYSFAKESPGLIHTNLNTWLYLGPFTCLIVSFFVSSLGARIYRNTAKEQINDIIPRQMTYFSWLSVITLSFVICILLSENIGIPAPLRWSILQLMISIIQLIIPLSVVLNVEQLQTYSITFVKNILEDTFFFNLYIIPPVLAILMYVTLYFVYKVFGI